MHLWGAIMRYRKHQAGDGAHAARQAKHGSNNVATAVTAAAGSIHRTARSAAAAATMHDPAASIAHALAGSCALKRGLSCSTQNIHEIQKC